MRQTLDHVAVVVGDLDAGRDAYRRLGFRLTPRSSHKGQLTADGPVEIWGSGNHCSMFARGYFEILGITDPARHSFGVDKHLARYQGLHLIALGCDDAAAVAAALKTRIDGVHDVVEVQRDVPQMTGGTRLGRFRILHLDDGLFAPAELFYIEHATPDVLWQPPLLDQPNGVIGLAAVTICTDDVAATVRDLSLIIDVAPTGGDGLAAFELAPGTVEIASPAALAGSTGGALR